MSESVLIPVILQAYYERERFTLPLKNLCLGRETEVERNSSILLKLAHAAQKSGKFGLVISQGGPQAMDIVMRTVSPRTIKA